MTIGPQVGLDGSGQEHPLAVDAYGRIALAEAASDLLGHVRTERARTIQIGYATYQADTDKFSSVVAGGGTVTYDAATGEYVIAVPAATPASAVLIHNHAAHCRPNRSASVTLTGSIANAAPAAGERLEWGCTSGIASGLASADAVGFAVDSSVSGTGVLCVFFRSSVSGGPNVTVRQSDWNVDKLDGDGPSEYVLDATQAQKINHYDVNVVWLGGWGIQWKVNGYVVHRVLFRRPADAVSKPFARSSHVRLYVWCSNASLAAANSFRYGRGVVESVSDDGDPATSYSAQRAGISVGVGASAPIISIRGAAMLGGVPNGKCILPTSISLNSTQLAQVSIHYGLLTDFTFTGASWAAPSNAAGTSAEIDVSATAVSVGSGAWLVGSYAVDTQADLFDLRDVFTGLTRNVGVRGDGSQVAVVAVLKNVAALLGTYTLGGLNWREV
jgi:hypothetical protein